MTPPPPRSLPLSARLADRPAELLVLADALREKLDREDAAALAWTVAELDGMLEQTDRALQRLTS